MGLLVPPLFQFRRLPAARLALLHPQVSLGGSLSLCRRSPPPIPRIWRLVTGTSFIVVTFFMPKNDLFSILGPPLFSGRRPDFFSAFWCFFALTPKNNLVPPGPGYICDTNAFVSQP